MRRLPDSSFFNKTPFAAGTTPSQAQTDAETTFELTGVGATGAVYKTGLNSHYSEPVTDTTGKPDGTFKFMNRIHLNQFALLLSAFGVDLMENGLKNLQFNSSVSGLVSGYPQNCSIPYVKATGSDPDTKDYMAFMQALSDGKTTAPTDLGGDTNWKPLTPSFLDLEQHEIRIVHYSTFQNMSDALRSKVTPQYDDEMKNVYSCVEYNKDGKGMDMYGALFGWGWDPNYTATGYQTLGSYRLFRIKQVFFNGNEIVEAWRGSNCVFCRYFNGTNCVVLPKTNNTGDLPLLCGRYEIQVGGGGGGGSAYCHH